MPALPFWKDRQFENKNKDVSTHLLFYTLSLPFPLTSVDPTFIFISDRFDRQTDGRAALLPASICTHVLPSILLLCHHLLFFLWLYYTMAAVLLLLYHSIYVYSFVTMDRHLLICLYYACHLCLPKGMPPATIACLPSTPACTCLGAFPLLYITTYTYNLTNFLLFAAKLWKDRGQTDRQDLRTGTGQLDRDRFQDRTCLCSHIQHIQKLCICVIL